MLAAARSQGKPFRLPGRDVQDGPPDCTNISVPPRAAHRRVTAWYAAGVAESRGNCSAIIGLEQAERLVAVADQ